MISIIMPVYNTGELLYESVESILNQSLNDFELLCVDDCSDDEQTISALYDLEKRDDRVSVLHLEKNTGAAEARNAGFKASKGEYTVFLDADDRFHIDMLRYMLDVMMNDSVDYCISSFDIIAADNGVKVQTVKPVELKTITDEVFRISEAGEKGLCLWNKSPWNKMYRASFLRNNGIRFQTLSSSNDVAFSILCAIKANGIAYCDSCPPLQYYQIGREGQISANKQPINYLRAIDYVMNETNPHYGSLLYRQIMYCAITEMTGELLLCGDAKLRKRSYNTFRRWIGNFYSEELFEDFRMNALAKRYLENSESDEWLQIIGDYKAQLCEKRDMLLSVLRDSTSILVWGTGKRGDAFQSFLRESGIRGCLATDRSNNNVGEKTEYGYSIIHTEEAIRAGGPIIATNNVIYEYLVSMLGKQERIINGQAYCPL